MICKIQVVTVSEDGRKETREITSIQRTDVKPETLGLTLAEGKMILKDLQQVVVESQVSSLLLPKRTCPECGEPRCSKGNHTLSVRTVFGRLTVRSPRLYHCVCRPHDTKTFSPLAELLPNHTLPELLFLETKWASLMSYGMTSKTLARRAADRRACQYVHHSPARRGCSGAVGAGNGRRTILFRRGLPAELGRTSCSRWSAYHWDRWWLCPRATQARTFRGDCRQEHLGF